MNENVMRKSFVVDYNFDYSETKHLVGGNLLTLTTESYSAQLYALDTELFVLYTSCYTEIVFNEK